MGGRKGGRRVDRQRSVPCHFLTVFTCVATPGCTTEGSTGRMGMGRVNAYPIQWPQYTQIRSPLPSATPRQGSDCQHSPDSQTYDHG